MISTCLLDGIGWAVKAENEIHFSRKRERVLKIRSYEHSGYEGLKSAQDRDCTERLAVSGAISDGTTNANAPNAYFTTYRLPLSV